MGQEESEEGLYVYPDLRTCIAGKFQSCKLELGEAAMIVSAKLSAGIMELSSGRAEGPQLSYELSTRDMICRHMHLRDPYEKSMVEVKVSGAEGGGEGVFACKDIPATTVVAFYNGIRIPADEEDTNDTWEDCSYRIFSAVDEDIDSDNTERIDMPAHLRSTEEYCATVGHKINHSFTPNCKFSKFVHPLYGPIPCVVTTEDVIAGQELFTYYKYLLSDCPDWYSNLWEMQGIVS